MELDWNLLADMRFRPVRLPPSMLIAVIILVLLSALVATDPDTPGGGHE